jgi:hypothetical protein
LPGGDRGASHGRAAFVELKISSREIRELLEAPSPEFPKYTTQLINLASGNAGATRPRIVGQMTDLVRMSGKRHLLEWEEWYRRLHPDTMKQATERILAMLEKVRKALSLIDREMVERWVQDLVIVKTFVGLRFHEAILKKLAALGGTSSRLATREEEARGIDGYVGDTPVSIKPRTYDAKRSLPEQLPPTIIFYEKKRDGIVIEFDPF